MCVSVILLVPGVREGQKKSSLDIIELEDWESEMREIERTRI